MNSYFVMAKMDDGDAPFDEGLIDETYPDNYPLVPGHAWLVVTRSESSFDVAKSLGLVAGGREDASGMVVPAKGCWGFAHRDLWRMLQPEGRPDAADPAGVRRLGGRLDRA